MVLDEATSAIDSQTESEIINELRDHLTGRTAIMIAHRLSTIAWLDRLIVLDDGKVAENRNTFGASRTIRNLRQALGKAGIEKNNCRIGVLINSGARTIFRLESTAPGIANITGSQPTVIPVLVTGIHSS